MAIIIPKRSLTLSSACLSPRGVVSTTRSFFQRYVLQKSQQFFNWYEEIFEKKFPSAFKLYKSFSTGVRGILGDSRKYFRISNEIRGRRKLSLTSLTPQELLTYYEVPRDMFQVFPVLVTSLIPFGGYVVLPFVYFFPKQCLSRQFWDQEQTARFRHEDHQRRMRAFPLVLRDMHIYGKTVRPREDQDNLITILRDVNSGMNPATRKLLQLRHIYGSGEMQLAHLKHKPARHLSAALGVKPLLPLSSKRRALIQYGKWLRALDLALYRHDHRSLSDSELQRIAYFHCFDSTHLDREMTWKQLENFIAISIDIDEGCLSLLLHSLILLNFNFITNRKLIEPLGGH